MRTRFSTSLLLRFGVLSTVLICVLGAVLATAVRGVIVDRAMQAADDRATVIARAGLEEHVTPERLAGMDPAELERFDRLVHAEGIVAAGVRRIKLFNDEPRIVYSDDRSKIGRSAAASDLVRAALAGRIGSKQTVGTDHSGAGERMLEVFVPLRRQRNGHAAGVLEVYLPYAPVAAEIREGTRRLYLAVLVGLAVLWLGLFRIVRNASRTLARQAGDLRRQALHDALTGLANRTLLEERMRQALMRARRERTRVAVLLLDLDDFKGVNDSLGHAAGDALLTTVAQRLCGALRAADTVARLGGDEFAVLLDDPGDLDTVTVVAERMLDALAAPVHLQGRPVYAHASLGIALSDKLAPDSDGDPDARAQELLRGADMAMYAAKARGKGCIEVFASHMHAAAVAKLERKGELQRAIDGGELVLHYQPIVDLDTGRIEGVEALARWNHPTRGLLGPGEFIPLAEETNLIVALGARVLKDACRQAARWREEFPDDGERYVSVNVAGAQLQRGDFVDDVRRALNEARLPANSLMLEITESSLLEDTISNARRLQGLRDLGVRLAVDDFGTGYSALNYLRRFRMDVLKIDRSFVNGAERSGEEAALLDAMLTMATALNLRVVAEGIEGGPQLAHLRARACAAGQGCLFARPMPTAELTVMLAGHPHGVRLDAAGERMPTPS